MGNLENKPENVGYLNSGEYPDFLIYDHSAGIYYNAHSKGDVRLQSDVCRNGYPFCYEWENFGFYFVSISDQVSLLEIILRLYFY